jgi:hypothetical protein
MHDKRFHVVLLLALLLAPALLSPSSIMAAPGDPPRVTTFDGGVVVEWYGAQAALRQAGGAAQELTTLGGVRVPAQLVVLRVAGDALVVPQIELLTSRPWSGTLPAAELIVPQTVGGERRPALAQPADASLPGTPVVVLRDARMRGARIVVLALSPVFAQNGAARSVTALRATIPGASPLAEDAARLLAAAGPLLASAPGPANPAAASGWKIWVTRAGIQRLPAATLSAAGVPLGAPANIHLYHRGVAVALEQRGAGASLEFRFYAPAPGDRWNAGETYWLTAEARPGVRMTPPPAPPVTTTARGDAIEQGVWRDNKVYDSLLPGADGDHWYAADFKTGPGQPPASLTVPLTATLPLIAGTTVLTVTGSAYTSGQHTLTVTLGGQPKSAGWKGAGAWLQVFTYTAVGTSATVTLLPGAAPDGVELDGVAWKRAVRLQFGGRGAVFEGLAGAWQYQLTGVPAGGALYDVTLANAPRIIPLSAGTAGTASYKDGPAPRKYVLAATGTLRAPPISRGRSFDPNTPGQALYIAPAEFHAALGPLVARRQSQGYSVRVIDVQAIYDAWSFGQVDPEAIRSFLRYAAASWHTAPRAVTLVGDGTSDPLNYTGRNNTNFIPPYLAMVDGQIGETACEPCYARLDTPDPTADLLADLLIGRLPVKSVDELKALVAKLVTYETSPLDLGWRSRALFVADNADPAGDFPALADTIIQDQPHDIASDRMYYDPQSSGASWREPDAVRAYKRTIAALNQGAGLVNYIGHGSQFQWATTDPQASPPYLLGLYDVDDLTNGPRQPILLEMTCLTGAFQTPAFSGTTIDERFLLRPDGGAIAVWAPTGQGVAHGHDQLQRGFYETLWSAPPLRATVGQLTAGGYLELYTSPGSCCTDALATYALLGDPLMTARVLPAKRMYAPLVRR